MSSPYTKDLNLEVSHKLQSNDIYQVSILSKEWFSLINWEFWMYKFIRDFGASLPNGVDYENEYVGMEKLELEDLCRYVVSKAYIKMLVYMLDKWKVPFNYLIAIAAHYGNIEIIKLLLANGADIHAQNDLALEWATYNGHLEVVKLLLDNGADIRAISKYIYKNSELNSIIREYKKKSGYVYKY